MMFEKNFKKFANQLKTMKQNKDKKVKCFSVVTIIVVFKKKLTFFTYFEFQSDLIE